MSRIYEFPTFETYGPESKEWKRTTPPAFTFKTKEEKQETEVEEIAKKEEERRNGDGYLWETIKGAETPLFASPYSTSALEKRLAETQTKLDEYAQTIDEFKYLINRIASARLDCEAVAASRESAMCLLSMLAEKHFNHQDEIVQQLNGTEEWLSLAWLMKADFVEHVGAYFCVTERGRQILEAVL